MPFGMMDTVEYVNRCCGRRVTPYFHSYGEGRGWEMGFKCNQCGRIRIPVAPLPDNGEGYLIEAAALRARLKAEGEADIAD